MYVQYPGCRAAILGDIHHHRSDTSFDFTPEIYSRIESQKRFCLEFVWRLKIQINEHTMVPIVHLLFVINLAHQAIGSALDVFGSVSKHTRYGFGGAYPRLNTQSSF